MPLHMMTWKRHFYSVFIKSILTTLVAFYAIYVLLDAMTHLKEIASGKTALLTWFIYYLAAFSKRLDILVPFSILVATIRTLHQFQLRGELIAMMTSGISRVRLMMPFIIVASSCYALLLINDDCILPKALVEINHIREADFEEEDIDEDDQTIHQILLEDSSRIIYRKYEPKTKIFRNAYWIHTPTELYYMKDLAIIDQKPVGSFVDHLQRNAKGEFQKVDSYKELLFTDLHIDKTALQDSVVRPQDQSLTQLINELAVYSRTNSSRLPEIKATFYYKLFFPLLCLVAFLGPAPRLLRFGRVVPILMIYLVSIASLFLLNLLFQAFFVIGKNNLIGPFAAIAGPWCILMFFLVKRFIKG